MRWPLDNVVITQGYRENPNLYGYGSFGHTGIDLQASIGTPVLSPVTGTVIGVGTNPSYVGGLYVIVRQDGGERWECYMGHLSQTLVSVGQQVGEGQVVAKSGATGNVTGPHVHFQVRHFGAGDLVNPQDLINSNVTSGGSSVDTIKSMYWRLLGREADQGGIDHYTQVVKSNGWEFVYLDLKNSNEGQADWVRRNPDRVKALEDGINQRDQMINDLKTALANEQAKPPKEVVKEVEKIVTKEVPVEVVKTVEVEPKWLTNLRNAILNALKGFKK